MIAEPELGDRIMRALILRRVVLIETGAGGPVLIGSEDAPDVVRLQGFLARNAYPLDVANLREFEGGGVWYWASPIVGADPATNWLQGCVSLDAKGFVQTGASVPLQDVGSNNSVAQPLSLQSSVAGVFAVGDVRSGSVKRVGAAIGEGAAVVAQLHAYLAAIRTASAEVRSQARVL
jgi:hypothetical protein